MMNMRGDQERTAARILGGGEECVRVLRWCVCSWLD